ncbi:hypothetical protein AAH994_07565 [Weeksellaceae bacterium A-14]
MVWIKYLSEIEIGSNKKNIFDYEGGRSDTNYSTDAGSLRKLISVYSAISNGNNIKIIEKYNLNYQYTNTKFKMRLTNNIRACLKFYRNFLYSLRKSSLLNFNALLSVFSTSYF